MSDILKIFKFICQTNSFINFYKCNLNAEDYQRDWENQGGKFEKFLIYRCLMGKVPKLSDNFIVKFYFGKIIANIF